MVFDYESYLTEKLNKIKKDGSFNFDIEVATEQAWVKQKTFKADTVYVVVKRLTSDIQYNSETQPIQLIVLCSGTDDDVNNTKALFDIFVDTYNWNTYTNNGLYIKQTYTKPVVVSNFNEVGSDYRSVIYLTGTLFLMTNLLDVKQLTITTTKNGVETTENVDALGFTLSYGMSGNTQQLATDNLASTVKSVATLNIAISIPLIDTQYNNIITSVMCGEISGNTNFRLGFAIGDGTKKYYNMKLTSASISTAPNSIPSLQLGFIK